MVLTLVSAGQRRKAILSRSHGDTEETLFKWTFPAPPRLRERMVLPLGFGGAKAKGGSLAEAQGRGEKLIE